MTRFPCPYLRGDVEFSDERERHVVEGHPDLLPELHNWIAATLAEPDEVRRSRRFSSARLFSRWYAELRGGKHVVVVVSAQDDGGHWIITAYIARKLTEGEVEWRRN